MSDNVQEKKGKAEEAIALINKEYGSNTINRLGGNWDKRNFEVISTGSLGIDYILGIGGFPKGRIIELIGSESSGKCLVPETMILTKYGLKTIEQIFNECGLDILNTNKEVEIKYPLINRFGKEENTTHFVYNGVRKTFKIRTRTGLEITSTYKHPLLVLNKYGFICWKWAGEIRKGDYLVTRRGDLISSNKRLVSLDEAYFLGLIVADGSIGINSLSFTNNDDTIKREYERIINDIEEFIDLDLHVYPNGDSINSYDYRIYSKLALEKFYSRVGIEPCNSNGKYIPLSILNSDIETQKNFIKGYFDCECSIDIERSCLEVTSSSYRLLKEIQLVLKNIGIISFLNKKNVKNYKENDYWRLFVYGRDFNKYIKEIGFVSELRKEQIKNYNFKNGSSNHDGIPNIIGLVSSFYSSIEPKNKQYNIDGRRISSIIYDLNKVNCSRENLNKILSLSGGDSNIRKILELYLDEHLYFDLVVNTEEGDCVPTFDFAMENTHTFIAESIVNHNTTIALHAIAEAQKIGGEAAFIDAEHALDPKYAKSIGVDVDSLALAQPDFAEQALDIVEVLVRSRAFDIIVVDSVAALVPKSELEGDMGSHHIGVQARLMSQAMRKLAGAVNRSGTICIFINQIREKVGVLFGSPEVTPGGRALKYYSSIRLDVRVVGGTQIKNVAGDIIGHKTKIKTIKNKCASPFKETEVEIIFGEGFNKYGEIVDLGSMFGIIKRNGAWYSYEGEKLGQGRNNIVELLRNTPELALEIEHKIRKELGMVVDSE